MTPALGDPKIVGEARRAGIIGQEEAARAPDLRNAEHGDCHIPCVDNCRATGRCPES